MANHNGPIISPEAIVYQTCVLSNGIAFGSKSHGPTFCDSLEALISVLRRHYDYVYHTNNNYYIYDRYYGRRHRVLIATAGSLYYAVLIKDVTWI
jgi:hypothetical protein